MDSGSGHCTSLRECPEKGTLHLSEPPDQISWMQLCARGVKLCREKFSRGNRTFAFSNGNSYNNAKLDAGRAFKSCWADAVRVVLMGCGDSGASLFFTEQQVLEEQWQSFIPALVATFPQPVVLVAERANGAAATENMSANKITRDSAVIAPLFFRMFLRIFISRAVVWKPPHSYQALVQ